MIQTFLKIWEFGKKRHTMLLKGLLFSFIKSVFGITQIVAVILALSAIMGEITIEDCVKQMIVLMAICITGNFVTSYVEQSCAVGAGFFMIGDKRVEVGNHLQKIPLGYFSDISAGKISATLTTTLSNVESAACLSIFMTISGLFGAFAMFLAMLFYDWRIGITMGVGMIAYFLVLSWQIKVSRKQAPVLQTAQNRLVEATLTFLQGIKVTKAFSFQRGDVKLQEALAGSCDANIDLTNKSMPSQYMANLTIASFESLLLLLSLYLGFVTKENPLMKTLILMIFSFMAYGALNQAGSVLSMIGLLDNGLNDVEKLEGTKPLTIKQPSKQAESNDIIFENVSFAYEENEVLQSISTTIKENSFTAVIGPSGSGKSTLCQLIPRFRDVSEGVIKIGGVDIRYMETEELMKKISMVFQKVYLFEDTILNNIRFGKPDATLEQVRAAAKAARCDEFIMALPNGYETRLEEGGSSLSGGEKQRISIARAILKDAPIIILDEATSALDAENEHEILAAIDELTRNKTVIMIAHRIKSVQHADHIIALEHGRIVQEGTHEELIKEKGLYADFIVARKEAVGWKLGEI